MARVQAKNLKRHFLVPTYLERPLATLQLATLKINVEIGWMLL